MKVVALTNFRDIDNFTKSYVEGESYEFPDKRAKELIKSGLVQAEGKSAKKGDEDISSREAELIEARKGLEGWANQLKDQEAKLIEREKEAVNTETKLSQRETELESKESAFSSKKAEMDSQAEELENLKSALESQQSDLESREAALVAKEEAKGKK
ncbi:chromosome segregation ATPase [Dysgonomonas sp. PH5-45]|uniref:hypothetical protein n=1 Tax=unclassified Dysgonomonas TaxID=2630389 RepID=UPI002473D7FA|nr:MULTISPECIES: hypothetical protein [unclassified Dysgonomonas]MDH6354736.1 chromosome segregation ATPase [Dysgonomonas sp. PH5-45]MDH6387635.1 chromosome segregation ATPase [Dysgonomonas sp. PH5-37]